MRETEVPPAMPDNNGNTHSDEIKQRNLTNRAVTRYLDWLAGKTPAPRSTTRTVEGELAKVDERLSHSDLSSTKRLKLLQDRRNLQPSGRGSQLPKIRSWWEPRILTFRLNRVSWAQFRNKGLKHGTRGVLI
jgi:hypothetical protein